MIRSRPITRGPRWLREAINDLREDWIAGIPRAGIGTTVTETRNGIAVNISRTAVPSQASPLGFEEITGVDDDGNPAVLQVAFNSTWEEY